MKLYTVQHATGLFLWRIGFCDEDYLFGFGPARDDFLVTSSKKIAEEWAYTAGGTVIELTVVT